MNCSLCGYQFQEDESVTKCEGCPFIKGCNLIRCPNCGLEVPAEPKILKFLKKRRRIKIGVK